MINPLYSLSYSVNVNLVRLEVELTEARDAINSIANDASMVGAHCVAVDAGWIILAIDNLSRSIRNFYDSYPQSLNDVVEGLEGQ